MATWSGKHFIFLVWHEHFTRLNRARAYFPGPNTTFTSSIWKWVCTAARVPSVPGPFQQLLFFTARLAMNFSLVFKHQALVVGQSQSFKGQVRQTHGWAGLAGDHPALSWGSIRSEGPPEGPASPSSSGNRGLVALLL